MKARDNGEDDAPGLAGGLAGMARSLFHLLASRLELAALELSEARDNALRLLLVGALAVIAACFALGCWTALVVVLAWHALGWTILLLVAFAYTLLAYGMLRMAKRMLAQGKLSLPATMAELRKDRDALL